MALLQDIQQLGRDVERLTGHLEEAKKTVARHEEQISGERGLSAAINVLSEEFKNLRRTIWLTGSGIMVTIVGSATKVSGVW
jgi:hypothetical protein